MYALGVCIWSSLLTISYEGEKKADGKDEKDIKGMHVVPYWGTFLKLCYSARRQRHPDSEDICARSVVTMPCMEY